MATFQISLPNKAATWFYKSCSSEESAEQLMRMVLVDYVALKERVKNAGKRD